MERIDGNLLVLIKDPLLHQTSSKLLFTIVMAIYSFCLALLLSVILWTLTDSNDPFTDVPRIAISPSLVILKTIITTLILSPVIETSGLIAVILLLERIRLSYSIQLLGASITWSSLHSLIWLPWGFIVAPLFFLCSYSFMRWRKQSFRDGFITAVLIHFWHNIIPTATLLMQKLGTFS